MVKPVTLLTCRGFVAPTAQAGKDLTFSLSAHIHILLRFDGAWCAQMNPMTFPISILSRFTLTLPALGALSLISCTTPGSSGIDGVVSVPTKWQAAKVGSTPLDTAALTKWWKRFHDPALDELVRVALESSPDVRTAVSKIAESRARRGVEKSSLYPSLTGGATALSSRTENRSGDSATVTAVGDQVIVKDNGSSQSTTRNQSYGGSLASSWEIDLFGKQWDKVKAASADVAQSEDNFHAAQVSLAAEVADAYVTLRQAQGQLAVLESTLATRSETYQITRWREQAGQGNALDTQQSLSTLEQARAAVPSIETTIKQSRNRLALLAGRTSGGVDAIVAKSRPIPVPTSPTAIGIPAETLQQRPDVRAAEQSVIAAAARTQSAQKERLPSLNISGVLSTESLSSGRVFNPESVAASVLGGLSMPIFKGGEITANIQIQTEQEKQALLAYESTVLTALSEVEDALVSVSQIAERLSILSKAVTAAREAQDLAAKRYTAGDVDLLTVLEAQRTLLSVEEQQVSARANQASAHIQLYKSLGGGWSSI